MSEKTLNAGVSLIELLTVITIAAVLSTIAIPSFKYVTTSNRMSAEINGLLGDMQYARYEAIKDGFPVVICPATPPSVACNNGTTTWSNGWIVLSNQNVVLRRQSAFAGTDILTAGANTTSVSFNREGFATLAGTVTFSLHDSSNNSSYTRCLITNAVGYMATATSGNTVNAVTC